MSSQIQHLLLSTTPSFPDLKNNHLKLSPPCRFSQASSYVNSHYITLLSHLWDTLILFLSSKILSARLHFVERIASLWKLIYDNLRYIVGTPSITRNGLLLASWELGSQKLQLWYSAREKLSVQVLSLRKSQKQPVRCIPKALKSWGTTSRWLILKFRTVWPPVTPNFLFRWSVLLRELTVSSVSTTRSYFQG